MINKAKPGDAVRINNTVFVKQLNGTWKSPFETVLESTFLSKLGGQKVDYLFAVPEKPVKIEKKHQKSAENSKFSLEIEPKEIENNVQEGKESDQ